MKTAISLPDDLFEQAEKFARERRLSRSELYQRAIQLYLTTQGPKVRDLLDRIYGDEPSRLDEPAARAQSEVLAQEDW